jgi:hypothetical protein
VISTEIEPAFLSQSDQRIVLPPFYADTAVPLSQALASNQIQPDTPLFVADLGHGRVISLSTRQMGIHPLAQGILQGQPWLVTF